MPAQPTSGLNHGLAGRTSAAVCALPGEQEFNISAVGKDDKLDMALKGSYAAAKYSVVATLAQSGKVRSCVPVCGQGGPDGPARRARRCRVLCCQLRWRLGCWQRSLGHRDPSEWVPAARRAWRANELFRREPARQRPPAPRQPSFQSASLHPGSPPSRLAAMMLRRLGSSDFWQPRSTKHCADGTGCPGPP